jgi:hypothetical protein
MARNLRASGQRAAMGVLGIYSRILFVFSRGDFGGTTVSPPSPWLALTALLGPLFKRNRILS